MRLLNLLKGKIHRATVTETNLEYPGSLTVDSALMTKAGLVAGELVHVWNVDNGERLETYLIPGEEGSGVICVNGAAARRCKVGDKIIIVAFVLTDEPVEPRVVLVDERNRFVGYA